MHQAKKRGKQRVKEGQDDEIASLDKYKKRKWLKKAQRKQ
jgi:hypothetical protein